jgi:hypothetical protein
VDRNNVTLATTPTTIRHGQHTLPLRTVGEVTTDLRGAVEFESPPVRSSRCPA